MAATGQKAGRANGKRTVRSVFISAPARTDVSVIRGVLEGEGILVTGGDDCVGPGQDIRDSIIDGVRKSDAVIAVMPQGMDRSNVYYEMGLADALEKPVLVVTSVESDHVSDLSVHPYLRARHDSEKAIRYGLVHFLHAPHHGSKPETGGASRTKPIGAAADRLLRMVRAKDDIGEMALVNVIAEAIRESGIETQAATTTPSEGDESPADLAVWSDELAELVGNPIPIEVRSSLTTDRAAKYAASALTRSVVGAGARWGLVIYRSATPAALLALLRPPVLSMAVEDFLEALREKSFARVVTDLRNRAVHGVG